RRGCSRVAGDTATSRLRGGSTSGARMRLFVHGDQLRVVEVRVLLRGRKRGVAEELLDAAEIGAGVQQMCGKRMAQRVRRHACAKRRSAHVAIEEAADGAGRDPLTATIEEEREVIVPFA